MITTLSFYDMDGTLLDTPLPDQGKQIWLEKKGSPYPYEGWWGRPESLDSTLFDIKPFPSVLNQLKRDQTKSDTYTVLLTSRMVKLQPQIETLLKQNGITFHDLSLKSGGEDKDVRIAKYLKKFPQVHTINVYDDRDKEILLFTKMKDDLEGEYQVNIYRVTDGNFALVSGKNPLERIVSEEVSIYTKNTRRND